MRPKKFNGRYISDMYADHKWRAYSAGIPFLLTIEEWYDWWIATGHWHERGRGKDKYCMARFNDEGPYQIGNIKCITNAENRAEQDNSHCKLPPMTPEVRKRKSEWLRKLLATPEQQERLFEMCTEPLTCPHCGKAGKGVVMSRWHFDNCAHR